MADAVDSGHIERLVAERIAALSGDIFKPVHQLESRFQEQCAELKRMKEALKRTREELKKTRAESDSISSLSLSLSVSTTSSLVRDIEAKIRQQSHEMYGALDLCIRGYNELIFDTSRPPRTSSSRIITRRTEDILEENDMKYITALLYPPQNLDPDVAAARNHALNILTVQEQHLCRTLIAKHKQVPSAGEYPALDRATALELVKELGIDEESLKILEDFLATDPTRRPDPDDWRDREWFESDDGMWPPPPKLFLFAADGRYTKLATLRENLEESRARLESLEATKKSVDDRIRPSVEG